MRQPRPHNPSSYHQNYLPNGQVPPGNLPNALPGAAALLPNQGRVIQNGPIRVLCVADVRGRSIFPSEKNAS